MKARLSVGGLKVCGDALAVASGLGPEPAEGGEVDDVEAVEAEGRSVGIGLDALAAEAGRDAFGAEQGGQEVAFGVAEARAVGERLGGGAGYSVDPSIAAVLHLVANPFKTATDHGDWILVVSRKLSGEGQDLGILPIHDRRRREILTHNSASVWYLDGGESVPGSNAAGPIIRAIP